jgi:hypothetical protein
MKTYVQEHLLYHYDPFIIYGQCRKHELFISRFKMSSIGSVEDPPSSSTYRMETGQDLIDLKQCRQQMFPADAW